uniref:G-protein coupled receptors family 1 profile domain-containing protein n=1 Tax=Zosterops lateralis melanops TaxID=1220523 RepID=A0A8D2NPJ4_ZOSLA
MASPQGSASSAQQLLQGPARGCPVGVSVPPLFPRVVPLFQSLQEPGMNGSVPGPLLVEPPGECVPNNPVQFILVPIIYCLVLCVGLPGNLVALLVFLQSGKVRKAIRIYLINLTLADILFNLTLPLWIHYYLSGGDWLLSEVACRLAGAAYYLATYSAITFMALIMPQPRWDAVPVAR